MELADVSMPVKNHSRGKEGGNTVTGKKYFNNDVFFTLFKKHDCPQCGKRLQRVRVSQIVNSNSPEAEKFNFSLGDSFMVGNVEFIWILVSGLRTEYFSR